jgi:hypothetical protein
MVEISLYGSGEGPGWVTVPGDSTAAFFADVTHDCTGSLRRKGFPGVLRALESLDAMANTCGQARRTAGHALPSHVK